MTQLALDFERPAGKGPKIRRFRSQQVIEMLRHGNGWQTAQRARIRTESDKRILRAIAEASEGQSQRRERAIKLTVEGHARGDMRRSAPG
jgi:hypothetical protein